MALVGCNVPGQSVVYEYLLTTEGGGGGGGGMVSLCHFSVSQQPANKVTKNETFFFDYYFETFIRSHNRNCNNNKNNI